MTLPSEVDLFLSVKRFRKIQTKRSKRRRESQVRLRKEAFNKERFGDRSKIIRMLADVYKGNSVQKRAELKISIPKKFSIIEDPVEAIHVIESFAKDLRTCRIRSIHIDQSKLQIYDLAANALLDLIASDISTENRFKRFPLKFTGTYPADPTVKRFIRSLGIIKHLGIRHEIANEEESAALRVFDRRNRHYHNPADPRKADFKTKTIMGFVDHINHCLGDHNRALTASARQKLCDYVGEILCNAEDHPGFVDWTIQGYLDNSLETPICEVAIFNFGKSISDTLRALESTSYTWKQIEKYLMLHSGQRLFSPTWRQKDLLTLMALQGHVSSKNRNERDTRGQGTVDLIDFFQRVYKECAENSPIKAKMAIVSGGTYILFDGKYQMREVTGRGKVIAFNAANDLYQKPDQSYVKALGKLHFPGTIISIRFPLSSTSTVALGET